MALNPVSGNTHARYSGPSLPAQDTRPLPADAALPGCALTGRVLGPSPLPGTTSPDNCPVYHLRYPPAQSDGRGGVATRGHVCPPQDSALGTSVASGSAALLSVPRLEPEHTGPRRPRSQDPAPYPSPAAFLRQHGTDYLFSLSASCVRDSWYFALGEACSLPASIPRWSSLWGRLARSGPAFSRCPECEGQAGPDAWRCHSTHELGGQFRLWECISVLSLSTLSVMNMRIFTLVLIYFMDLYNPLSKPAVCVPSCVQPRPLGSPAAWVARCPFPLPQHLVLRPQPMFLAAPGRPLEPVPTLCAAKPLPAASVFRFHTRSETNSFSSAATARWSRASNRGALGVLGPHSTAPGRAWRKMSLLLEQPPHVSRNSCSSPELRGHWTCCQDPLDRPDGPSSDTVASSSCDFWIWPFTDPFNRRQFGFK